MKFPPELINKRVPFGFMGERLFFDLSPALFSSFKIDDGSRLLLKTLARNGELEHRDSVIDLGCGVGILGIALKKRFPAISLSVHDRDLLAVAMTLHNAGVNTTEVDFAAQGLLHRLSGERADLLVCNVPAKAGPPVHRAFLHSLGARLNPGGTAALVIVTPLEEEFRAGAAAAKLKVVYEEKTANHVVLHLAPEDTAVPQEEDSGSEDGPGAAFRQHRKFQPGQQEYHLETVYGLPDFDTPSYAVRTALRIIPPRPAGRALFINPGQGHIAAHFAASGGLDFATVAGRDMLQLLISARNLEGNAPGLPIDRIPALRPQDIDAGTGPFDWITLEPETIPGVSPGYGINELAGLLSPGGRMLVYGKSAEIHVLLKAVRGLNVTEGRKYRGFRAVLLKSGGNKQFASLT